MKNFSQFFQALNSKDQTPIFQETKNDPINIPGNSGIRDNLDSLLGTPVEDNVFSSTKVPFNFRAMLYSLLRKWYLLIIGPAMYITYKLFDALEKHKVFQILYNDAVQALNQMIETANKCFSRISDIDAFFSCF